MQVEFIRVNESHLQQMASTYNYYVNHSVATFHTEDVSIEEMKTFIYLDHPLYPAYCIYADKTYAGYCFLTRYKPRQAYDRTAEVTVYLENDFTGKSLGKIALQHLENYAKQKGLKNLLGIITLDNIGSVKLFENQGYLKCAHFKNVGEKFGKVLDVVAFQKEI